MKTKFKTIEISDPRFEQDGIRQITAKSPALKGRVDTTVFIPKQAQKNIPVIVLLHGVYGSHWAWIRKGGVHLTLQKMIDNGIVEPFILVMPSDGLWGDGSGYVPHVFQNFEQWIGVELPDLIRQTIESVTVHSNFYIGGLSMGGYGAFRIGLLYTETYKGISGLSSVTDIRHLSKFVEEDWSFGKVDKNLNSIQELIVAVNQNLPPFRFDCGSSDMLIEDNQKLYQWLIENGIKHHYKEFEGGHEWAYWEKNIEHTITFFNDLENGKL